LGERIVYLQIYPKRIGGENDLENRQYGVFVRRGRRRMMYRDQFGKLYSEEDLNRLPINMIKTINLHVERIS